jgi:hypothetical protein
MLVSLAPRPALAQATINVTTTADNMITPCTGVPPCTLRGAILQANADPGSTINVPGGPAQYVLNHNFGSLTVTAPMTIRATGSAGNAVINGQDATSQVPVLVNNSNGAAGPLALSGLTITNGLSTSLILAGGISSTGSSGHNGNLTLDNVIVTNNTGLLAGGIQSMGDVTMTNSSVTGNTATAAFSVPGGGFLLTGTLTMTNGSVSGNTAIQGGGGISGQGSRVTLNNVAVTGNTGATGGASLVGTTLTTTGGSISNNVGVSSAGGVVIGILNSRLVATGTTFSSNTGPLGGAIVDADSMVLTGVTVSGNSSGFHGGGIEVGFSVRTYPGGPGTATIDQSTITDNSTSAGGGVGGGGVYVHDGSTLTLTRSTVANNRTPGVGGGILATGNGSGVALTNDTISGNSALQGGGVFQGTPPGLPPVTHASTDPLGNRPAAPTGQSRTAAPAGASARAPIKAAAPPALGMALDLNTVASNTANTGGGIDNASAAGSPFGVHNSIVALNAATTTGPDCQGLVSSQGYNLESASSCGFAAAGDTRNTDPQLAALANNGGPTQTRALLLGSPAIDTADPTCPANSGEATDQRGVTRPIGRACDRGAFEAPALPAPPSTGKESNAGPAHRPEGSALPPLLGLTGLVAGASGWRRRRLLRWIRT